MFRNHYSEEACRDGISHRHFDCEACEHYKFGCEFSKEVKYAIETMDTSRLPRAAVKDVELKIAEKLMAETERLNAQWKSRVLDPKRLP